MRLDYSIDIRDPLGRVETWGAGFIRIEGENFVFGTQGYTGETRKLLADVVDIRCRITNEPLVVVG